MARPKIEINEEMLIKCAERQWTDAEIAAFFKVSIDTIHRRYADQIDSARHSGKAKLRDLIWKRALAGSDRLLEHAANRFLGPIKTKVELDAQTLIEVIEQAITGRDTETN